MKKTHISSDGVRRRCDAQKNCKFSGADRDFPTPHDYIPDHVNMVKYDQLQETHYTDLSEKQAKSRQSIGIDVSAAKYRLHSQGESVLLSTELYANEVDSIASGMHEEWQQARNFEPRMKDDGNGGEVDIANTPYSQLPDKWKKENYESAAFAVEAALKASAVNLSKTIGVDEVAEQIHVDWLVRNGSWAEDSQKLPYSQLSEEEREKDRVIARQAINAIGGTPTTSMKPSWGAFKKPKTTNASAYSSKISPTLQDKVSPSDEKLDGLKGLTTKKVNSPKKEFPPGFFDKLEESEKLGSIKKILDIRL